jgi:hypothetical protein
MERVAVTLGLLTATLVLITFTSSRSYVSLMGRFGLNLTNNHSYRIYYRYHGQYWIAFAIILFIHVSMGLMHIVLNTFVDDPDAYLHVYVLTSGVVGLMAVSAILTSCRSLLGFIKIVLLKNPLSSINFQAFYNLHTYFWLVLLVLIAGHYWVGFLHVGGFWPG